MSFQNQKDVKFKLTPYLTGYVAFTSKMKHFCGWYKEYRDENPNPDYLETYPLVKGNKT